MLATLDPWGPPRSDSGPGKAAVWAGVGAGFAGMLPVPLSPAGRQDLLARWDLCGKPAAWPFL